jgi:uncharacterized phage protein (TIGR02220 family)
MASKVKRMFSSVITKQDEFLDMPLSAQALYFHINMEADDEGFVSNVKSLMRQVRSSEDDLKILVAKRYLLTFESGVVVIKHWLIHNTIRQDRVIETTYKDEKKRLAVKENMSYTEKTGGVGHLTDTWQTHDGHLTDKCPPNLTNLNNNKDIVIYKEEENIKDIKDLKDFKEEIKYIIDYLNLKLDTRYRYNNTQNNKFITARIEEGFSVDDFIKVVDVKYKEWNGTDMAKFLNPQTLFRPSNFEKYLNQSQVEGSNRWSKIDMEDF